MSEDRLATKFQARNSEQFSESGILGDDYTYHDEVTSLIGDGKHWQIVVTVVLLLCGLCPEYNNSLAVVSFFSPVGLHFHCHKYPQLEGWTIQKWISLSHYNGTDPCRIYDLDYTSLPSNFSPSTSLPTIACNKTKFSYDHGQTLTEKWKMICNRDHLIPTYQYLFFFGKALGNILIGIWCDRRGRRNLLVLCVLMQPMLALIVIGSTSYNTFVLGLSLLGFFVGGAFVLSMVYVVEMLGPKKCTIFGSLSLLSLGLSSFCLSFVQLALPRWFYMQVFISVPVIIFLMWIDLFEESPRWLLVMLRVEDALRVMKVIAHKNKIHLSSGIKLLPAPQTGIVGEEDDDRHCNIWNVRNYPNLRLLIILLIFLHYGISVIQQVRTQRFKILRTKLPIQAATMGCIELTSVACAVILVLKFGYTKVISVSMVLYGILSLFLLIFVHSMEEEDYVMSVVLSIITYFFVTMAYVSVCVFSARIFPTIIRGSGYGITSAAYNVGVMLVIFILRSTMSDVKVYIVSLSMLSFLLALIGYVLPEAVDRELPDTLRDGEHFQRFLEFIFLRFFVPLEFY